MEDMIIRSACNINAESRAKSIYGRASTDFKKRSTNELNQTGDSEIFIHKFFFKQSLLKNTIDGFWDRL